jgi:ethanolamine transporter EutH
VDGFNSLFLDLRLPHLYEPHNLVRLGTGLGTGVGMAAFLVPVANGLIWRDEDERPSFARVAQLGVLLPVLVLAFLLVASQVGWLLYPLAFYSTAGLLIALSLVNLVFMLGLSGRIGRMTSYRQLFPIFTCALILTVAELSALSLLKTAALHALGSPL